MKEVAFLCFVFGMLFGTSVATARGYWLQYLFAVVYAALAATVYWNHA